MERAITGFRRDDLGDWVAELACGHDQHVRHRPPFQERPWVTTPGGRAGRIGAPLECPLCDRAELPATAQFVRTSAIWDRASLPAGLRRAHRLGPATWGRIVVLAGRIDYRAATTPPTHVVLAAGSTQYIPPGVEHQVEVSDEARFHLELFAIERG